jgi:hypothetical protein
LGQFPITIEFNFRPAPVLEHRVREITTTTRTGTNVLDFGATEMLLDSGVSLREGFDRQIYSIFIELPSRQRISCSNVENEAYKPILAFCLSPITAAPSVPSMRRPVRVKSVFPLPSCGFLKVEPSRLCRHPSMRRPVRVKSVFPLPSCGFLKVELSRLCRHPSIRTLC